MLDQQDQLYTIARMCGSKPPFPSFFTLGKPFTRLRRTTPWLQETPYVPVRYTLKRQATAWQRYFKGQSGRRKFKKRGNDSVTLPQDVRIEAGRLHFPKIGWMRLSRRGGNPYAHGRPVSATIKRVCASPIGTAAPPARMDDLHAGRCDCVRRSLVSRQARPLGERSSRDERRPRCRG